MQAVLLAGRERVCQVAAAKAEQLQVENAGIRFPLRRCRQRLNACGAVGGRWWGSAGGFEFMIEDEMK